MQDVILHLPEWLSNHNSPKKPDRVTVIFFLTGNPGLIGYYKTFLQLLAHGSGKDAVVTGISLGGFETTTVHEENSIHQDILFPPSFTRRSIYNLTEQIELCQARLEHVVWRIRRDHASVSDLPIQVILIGHSVGAYIALELVRRCHDRCHVVSQTSADGTLFASSFKILATVLLTPTICDIAHSPSGKIASPVLGTLPFFPALIQLGASVLTSTIWTSWLRKTVEMVTGMKSKTAVDTTVSFLMTPGAVKQALHMARCEMLEIREGNWTEEIWGVAQADICGGQQNLSSESEEDEDVRTSSTTASIAPKHFFLFAKEDHWVANVTRESIAKNLEGRAELIVDEDGSMGLVHAWCLDQSEIVAEVVNRWIEQICVQRKS